MSENVQFETDQTLEQNSRKGFTSRTILGAPQVPGMAKWFLKHGIKSESAAKWILLSIVIVCLTLSGVVYYLSVGPMISVGKNKPNSPVKEKISSFRNQTQP